jgi:glycosyltransferase involved in cell wall biosynthesis
MAPRPLKVAWISDFPVEWLADAPAEIRSRAKGHPSTWQRVLLEQFEKREDLKLHIVCLRKGLERDLQFERNGVHFHVVKVRGIRLAMLYWPDTLVIRRLMKKIAPDLVHAWGSERAAALVAQRLGLPNLTTMQGLLEWYGERTRMNAYFQVMARFERYTLKRARVATVESRFGVDYLRAKYPRLSIMQAEHAPAEIFHRIIRKPETAPMRFLFVGTAGNVKGTDLLLEALTRLKNEIDFRLTIVGRPLDTFRAELESALRSDLGARIEHKESCTPAEVADELARCAIMLFPTRADNSPNAVKEAVVAGVPVVASAVGGIPDYVQPGLNGELFRSGDVDDFVRAIRAACAHPLFKMGEVDPGALTEKRAYLSPFRMGNRFREGYDFALRKFAAADGNQVEVDYA